MTTTISEIGALAEMPTDDLRQRLADIEAEHKKTALKLASDIDGFDDVLRELKGSPANRVRLELTVRSEDGKKKETYEAPEAVDTTSAHAVLSNLQRRAMTGDLISRHARRIAEVQATKRERSAQLRRETERFEKERHRVQQALANATEHDKQLASRQSEVFKSLAVQPVGNPRRSMTDIVRERLGLTAE